MHHNNDELVSKQGGQQLETFIGPHDDTIRTDSKDLEHQGSGENMNLATVEEEVPYDEEPIPSELPRIVTVTTPEKNAMAATSPPQVVEHESIEQSSSKSPEVISATQASNIPRVQRQIMGIARGRKTLQKKIARNQAIDSFQASLESIDSLAESYWDPDDENSFMTPVVNNSSHQSAFFDEHVRFLKVQTQPREVEVVWTTDIPVAEAGTTTAEE